MVKIEQCEHIIIDVAQAYRYFLYNLRPKPNYKMKYNLTGNINFTHVTFNQFFMKQNDSLHNVLHNLEYKLSISY